jgi:hypothetical protein
MVVRRLVALTAFVLASPSFAAPISGGFTGGHVDPDGNGPLGQQVNNRFVNNSTTLAAGVDLGAGANFRSKIRSGAFVNKLSVSASANPGFVFGSALSFFAVNQTVSGPAGTPVRVRYDFLVDGQFTPGPSSHYFSPGNALPQSFNFLMLAYAGSALSLNVLSDQNGGYLDFQATSGAVNLTRVPGLLNYYNTLPAPLAFASACGPGDVRCSQGGVFNDVRSLSFDVMPGTDYFVVGFLTAQTNGEASFFNTARLLQVEVPTDYSLISDDGGVLKRGAGGAYVASVPEPASWAMLISGFGLVGAMQRRRRLPA